MMIIKIPLTKITAKKNDNENNTNNRRYDSVRNEEDAVCKL